MGWSGAVYKEVNEYKIAFTGLTFQKKVVGELPNIEVIVDANER